MKLEVSLPGVLTRELVEWIIHPLWASVFSSLKWRCWARWPHGPNMLCLGDKPSFSPFQPCSASPTTYSRIWQLLPNGYSEFSVLLPFNWKKNCPHPCYFCFSSWCYSKKEKTQKMGERRGCGRWTHLAFSADLLLDFFSSPFLTGQRVWFSWKWYLTVQMLINLYWSGSSHLFLCLKSSK